MMMMNKAMNAVVLMLFVMLIGVWSSSKAIESGNGIVTFAHAAQVSEMSSIRYMRKNLLEAQDDHDDEDDHDDHDDDHEDDHDDHDDDHDDHGHGEPCYCLAMENAWELDCLNTTGLVLPALEYIIDPFNGCSFEDAGSDMSCLNNYHIVQAHHDHCPHDALDAVGEWMDVENILHDYEDFFLDCEIGRLYDPTLESCPIVDCENTPAMMEAVATLTSGACEDSCDYSCSMAFQIVLSVHDVCDEDDVPYVLETSLHDYEEICEEHLCNSVGPDFDITLVDCDDHDDEDDHDDHDDDHEDDHDD